MGLFLFLEVSLWLQNSKSTDRQKQRINWRRRRRTMTSLARLPEASAIGWTSMATIRWLGITGFSTIWKAGWSWPRCPLSSGLTVQRWPLPSVSSSITIWIGSPAVGFVIWPISWPKWGEIWGKCQLTATRVEEKTAQKCHCRLKMDGRGGENRTPDLLLPKQVAVAIGNV